MGDETGARCRGYGVRNWVMDERLLVCAWGHAGDVLCMGNNLEPGFAGENAREVGLAQGSWLLSLGLCTLG